MLQVYMQTRGNDPTSNMMVKRASQTASNWVQKEDPPSYNSEENQQKTLERYKADYRHKYQRQLMGLGQSGTPAHTAGLIPQNVHNVQNVNHGPSISHV